MIAIQLRREFPIAFQRTGQWLFHQNPLARTGQRRGVLPMAAGGRDNHGCIRRSCL